MDKNTKHFENNDGLLFTSVNSIKKTKSLDDLVGCAKSTIKLSLDELEAASQADYGQGFTAEAKW